MQYAGDSILIALDEKEMAEFNQRKYEHWKRIMEEELMLPKCGPGEECWRYIYWTHNLRTQYNARTKRTGQAEFSNWKTHIRQFSIYYGKKKDRYQRFGENEGKIPDKRGEEGWALSRWSDTIWDCNTWHT